MKTSNAFKSQQRLPNLYSDLLKGQFNQEIVNTIKVDLPRTFPDNIFFEQYKSRLFNILIAYAEHNPVVGYCQGMNYIAGECLSNIRERGKLNFKIVRLSGLILIVTKDEESTFWLLRELIETVVPEYHTKTMKGLIRDINVLAELVKRRAPEIDNKVEELGLPWQVITTKWFICIFAEVLPVETVLRIWDCLFFEGYKILFRVSLNLLLKHKQEILQCNDISDLAVFFRNISASVKVINCHEFLEDMFKLSLSKRELERLRIQFTTDQ